MIIFKIATAVLLIGSKFNIYMKLSHNLGFGRDYFKAKIFFLPF